jgi:hypothetical protein
MTFVRRYCVLLAIMFWQGGFTFYGAVVVHVGNQVLGSHLEQGFVTRSVTNYLNLAGIVALCLWGWDIASANDASVVRRRLRLALWLLLLLTLGLLVWLHLLMDEYLDVDPFRISDRPRFRFIHDRYLNISTVQWVGSLILTGLTLLAWRSEDSSRTAPPNGYSGN